MRGKVFTLASVALISCRAVLGIEELDEVADAGKTTSDGGAGAKDATGDVNTGADSGSTCAMNAECGKCCREADKEANKRLEGFLKTCLCEAGPGACTDCVSTDVCGQSTPAPNTNCIPCIDGKIKADSCPNEKKQCGGDTGCKAVYDCIHSCP